LSDISIPGVNSRFNTTQMIDDLMEVERIPLQRMESRIEELQGEKRVWQDVNRYLNQFRDSVKVLFSFENPFNERNATSSEERIIRATANRQASEGTTELVVKQLATADRFISGDLPRDMEIEAGTYTFKIADDEVRLRYRGGDLDNFSEALNRRNPELLRSSVIRNTSTSQVLIIESMKSGSEFQLSFEEDARQLALNLEMIEETRGNSADLGTDISNIKQWQRDIDAVDIGRDGETLRFGPNAEARIEVPSDIEVTEALILEYEVRLRPNDTYAWSPPPIPQGPDLPGPTGVEFQGLYVEDIANPIDIPEYEEPEAPPIVEDNQILFLSSNQSTVALPALQDSLNFQTVQVKVSDYTQSLDSLNIRNRNSVKDLEIRNIRVYDPSERADFRPRNALATAGDAVIELEGIQVIRPSNNIDDVIPGVNLELRRASEDPVEITVEPDRELVKEKLIEFVALYNQVVREVNILTRNNEDVIDEIDFFTDDERAAALERLALFQGDSTLNQLKTRFQNITQNQYETRDGSDLALLAQIGISTNASRGDTGFSASRLRGYLEINEEVLDDALNSNFLAIKDLFGSDSDGDLLVDRGIGFELDQFITPFVQIGGIIANRTTGYDSQIASTNDDIRDYEDYLDDYEQDLRVQFGNMESSINALEANSQDLLNLNNQNNQ
jgi:flagellar hook-associated protein 2